MNGGVIFSKNCRFAFVSLMQRSDGAEPDGGALFQEISPPLSTDVEKVVEMTWSCIKKGASGCGRRAPAARSPKPL